MNLSRTTLKNIEITIAFICAFFCLLFCSGLVVAFDTRNPAYKLTVLPNACHPLWLCVAIDVVIGITGGIIVVLFAFVIMCVVLAAVVYVVTKSVMFGLRWCFKICETSKKFDGELRDIVYDK